MIMIESNRFSFFFATFFLDLLGLSCFSHLLLDSLLFSFFPLRFGLHEIAIESDLLSEVDALCKLICTIKVVLP